MKHATIAACALLLAGCATNYPNLYSPPAPAMPLDMTGLEARKNGETDEQYQKRQLIFLSAKNPLHVSIIAASNLQNIYEQNYKQAGMISDALEVPTLVAAGVAGLILLGGGADRTEDVARLGIIAGTYAAGRGALSSSDMSSVYIQGHGALSCAIIHATVFLNPKTDGSYDRYGASVARQGLAIAALEKLNGMVPGDAGSTELKAQLNTARTLAAAALGNARTARKAALGEIVAFDAANSEFQLEASEISIAVASKGRVRTAVSYSTLLDSFKPGDSAPSEGEIEDTVVAALVKNSDQAAAGRNHKLNQDALNDVISYRELVAATIFLTDSLLSATATLEGTSPGYSQRIEMMRRCSDGIG